MLRDKSKDLEDCYTTGLVLKRVEVLREERRAHTYGLKSGTTITQSTIKKVLRKKLVDSEGRRWGHIVNERLVP